MEDSVFCPIHRAINILQEKWTMHIVRGLLGGPLGFNELRRIAGGVNAATLSQRLEHLEEIGILTKTIQSLSVLLQIKSIYRKLQIYKSTKSLSTNKR